MKFTPAQLKRWQDDPAKFIETQLIDPVTNKPFVLLPAEREFVKLAFRIDPKTGRLMYPEMVYATPRKGGKTGFAAMMMLAMVLLFGGRYGEGYCASNDLEQSETRVYQSISRIVDCSPLFKNDSDVTRSKVIFPQFGDATITAIANDAAGAAGHNACFSCFDELWGFTSERSRRLWDEMSTSPVRKISGRLTVSYAGFEGESVLLEELYKRGLSQPKVGKDLYCGDGILMFWTHDPVAPWQTQAWLDEQRRSLRPNQYLRQIENRFVTNESSFVDLGAWDACVDPQMTPLISDLSLPIFIGVDASTKHDSTAVVAVAFNQDTQKIRIVSHRVFQPSPDDPLDFESTIEETVLDLAKRFQIRMVLFDPWQMQAVAQRLSRAGILIEEFPQTSGNLTSIGQNLYDLINGRNLVAYPDAAMRLAVSRAVAIETSRGWRITKEKQSHKIDTVIALAMACQATIAAGAQPPQSYSCIGVNMSGQSDRVGRSFEDYRKDIQEATAAGETSYDDQLWNETRRAVLGPDFRSKLR